MTSTTKIARRAARELLGAKQASMAGTGARIGGLGGAALGSLGGGAGGAMLGLGAGPLGAVAGGALGAAGGAITGGLTGGVLGGGVGGIADIAHWLWMLTQKKKPAAGEPATA